MAAAVLVKTIVFDQFLSFLIFQFFGGGWVKYPVWKVMHFSRNFIFESGPERKTQNRHQNAKHKTQNFEFLPAALDQGRAMRI